MYKNIPIQTLRDPLFTANEIIADVLRLDLLHPVVSGNKWFKLKYYLQEAHARGKTGILSFGGAYSNHLVALAYACRMQGLRAAAIIRGEPGRTLNSSLLQMEACGMERHFVSRAAYKDKALLTDDFLSRYPGYLAVPEGGQGEHGIAGAADILAAVTPGTYTHLLCAAGTGTTMAGLLRKAAPGTTVLGVSCLKLASPENSILETLLRQSTLSAPVSEGPVTGGTTAAFDRGHRPGTEALPHSPGHATYRLLTGYHFGGYARKTPALIHFMNRFFEQEGIPTDFVYTGKLFYALYDLAAQRYFPPGSKILVIHSGGLQGNRSLPPGTLGFESLYSGAGDQ